MAISQLFPLLLVVILPTSTFGLYGYDCGEQLSNLTSISLLDVDECDIKQPRVNITNIYGQLLQINDYGVVSTYKCGVKITRTATHCGMHSHAARVAAGEISYYKDMTREECVNLHLTGHLSIAGTSLFGLQRNSTEVRSVEFAGRADNGGSCEGGSFSDAYGSYKNAYVAGYVEVKLYESYQQVHLEANRVKLSSGVTCVFTDGNCIDEDASYVFWAVAPEDKCGVNNYTILYEGNMDKVVELDDGKTMYSLESEDVTFALMKKAENSICGLRLERTEHPKLFVLENARAKTDL